MTRLRAGRWLPLWLGGLAAAGTVAAHAIAYAVVAPDPHERAHLLDATGHRAWDAAAALLLGGLVVAVSAGLVSRRRSAGPVSLRGMAVGLASSQTAAFLLLEIAERAVSGGGLHRYDGWILACGVAAQVAVALVVAAVVSGVAHLVRRLTRFVQPQQRPRSDDVVPEPDRRALRRVDGAGATLRGPPLGAAFERNTRDRRQTMRVKSFAAVAVAVSALLAAAAPASAHVTANPNTAPATGFFTTFFRVGHGCEGKGPDTSKVSVQIPEGVLSAGPEDEPGWDAEVKMRKLDEPIEGEHGEITEVPSEVTWTTTGPPLDTHQFREFGISLQLGAEGQDVLWFPTVQKCEKGSLRWVNIPDSIEEWGDTEDPAPYLEITAAEEDEATEAAPGGMSEDDVRAIAASEASAVEPADDGTDSLVWVALLLGAVGFLLGAGAFVRSGRRT